MHTCCQAIACRPGYGIQSKPWACWHGSQASVGVVGWAKWMMVARYLHFLSTWFNLLWYLYHEVTITTTVLVQHCWPENDCSSSPVCPLIANPYTIRKLRSWTFWWYMGLLSTDKALASYRPAKVSVLKSGRKGASVATYSTADRRMIVAPLLFVRW